MLSGMLFTWLSKGNYLENRKEMVQFLQSEKLDKVPLKFYLKPWKILIKYRLPNL
jgi:hypothetical protein